MYAVTAWPSMHAHMHLVAPLVSTPKCKQAGIGDDMQALKEKVEGDYNASQANAVTQGLDGNPVVLIQVVPPRCTPFVTHSGSPPGQLPDCCSHRAVPLKRAILRRLQGALQYTH